MQKQALRDANCFLLIQHIYFLWSQYFKNTTLIQSLKTALYFEQFLGCIIYC